MRFFATAALSALALAAFAQKVEIPDANMDSLIVRLEKDDDPYEAYYFGSFARFNWPRVMWHYRNGNGHLRNRIVLQAASPYNPVWEAAHADADPEIRRTVLNLDVSAKNVLPAELIRKWLHDPYEPNRYYAVQLARLDHQMDLVWSMTKDPSPIVRTSAALPFAYGGEERAIVILLANRNVKYPDYARMHNYAWQTGDVEYVSQHLVYIGLPTLLVVRPLLHSRNPKDRLLATNLIGGVQGPGFFEELVRMTHDPDDEVVAPIGNWPTPGKRKRYPF